MRYEFLNTRAQIVAIVFVAAICVVTISKISSARNASTAQSPEVLRLETRLAQMEQRLFMFETSLRNLDSRFANMSSRGGNASDSAALGTELYVLQQHLAEQECALAKLDERTLPADVRNARKKTGASNNACRMNFETPLRLPSDR